MADLDPVPPLPVRAGAHGTFLAAMIDRLSSADLPELAGLTTRDPSDPALALLDSWAVIGDVLTFYTERIATEGFLHTALERRSLAALAALVGYRPRPGLAADAWLAYQVDPDPAASDVTIPAGSKVQSVPDPGGVPPAPAGVPQMFETESDLVARQVWNALPARAFRPMLLDTLDARCRRAFWLRGVGLGLAANDRLAVHFRADPAGLGSDDPVPIPPSPRIRLVDSVLEDPLRQVTAVRLARGDCRGHAAQHIRFDSMDALRIKATTFGAAAPLRPAGPPVIGIAAADPLEWSLDPALYDADDRPGTRLVLPLDAEYPRITAGGRVVVERPGAGRKVLKIVSVDTRGIAAYGVSGRVTRLTVDGAWFDPPDEDNLTLADLRGVTVWAQAEPMTPSDEPITDPVAGPTVDVAADVADLPVGRWIVLTGTPSAGADPQPPGEVARIAATKRHASGGPGNTPYTTLRLVSDLTGSYDPATVTVFANVVDSTNGETRDDPAIGSGDATATGQEFALSQKPLTYIASSDADGEDAELTVRVDGVTWHEVPLLARTGPAEHAYQVVTTGTGEVHIRFGDGVHGARLPSGQGNVSARYRVGIGSAGNVGAGRLTQLITKPLGTTAVQNPLAASGGADPDDATAIRERASLGVAALDRVVGLRDYETFALARGGVGKAAAYRIAAGGRELVQVSLAGVAGAALDADSEVVTSMAVALGRFGDPGVPVEVAPATAMHLVVEAAVTIDADRSWELVRPLLSAALNARLGVRARAIGQGVYAAEVVTALQLVPDVIAVDLVRLGETTGTTEADAGAVKGRPDHVPARAARPGEPAELLAARTDLPGFTVLNQEVIR